MTKCDFLQAYLALSGTVIEDVMVVLEEEITCKIIAEFCVKARRKKKEKLPTSEA